MQPDISKHCSDFLRTNYSNQNGKLKASHSREIVAAFFGYKSHAALIADDVYPITQLDDTSILVPDITLITSRLTKLNGIPDTLPDCTTIVTQLISFLSDKVFYNGESWIDTSLGQYLMDIYLPDNDAHICDLLAGLMAETNAYFDETIYETATIVRDDDIVTVVVEGNMFGKSDEDKMFFGDQLDITVTVELYRSASRIGFSGVDISASGVVNDDLVDPDIKAGKRV